MSIGTEALRATEFAWMNQGSTVYMNAASTGPTPARSVAEQHDFTSRRAAPHTVGYDAQFGTLNRCRTLVAEMINANVDEIALAANTGAGVNLAAWGLRLGKGDEVVVSDAEFPANMYPWLGAAQAHGFSVHVVPARGGLLDEDALIGALERPNVKVLALSWVGFSTGFAADIDRIGDACRSRNIKFVLDAIQGLGALTIDVAHTYVDVLACGGQKWLLSPWGSGFTYVRRDALESIVPQPVSWMAVRDADDFSRLIEYDFRWRPGARRFEQVTLAYQDFAGMAASLELLREIGYGLVSQHICSAAASLLDRASAGGIPLVTPVGRVAGIASVRPRDAALVSERMTGRGIIHSLREGTIRLAPHCYTTEDDIDRTIEALSA